MLWGNFPQCLFPISRIRNLRHAGFSGFATAETLGEIPGYGAHSQSFERSSAWSRVSKAARLRIAFRPPTNDSRWWTART